MTDTIAETRFHELWDTFTGHAMGVNAASAVVSSLGRWLSEGMMMA